MRVLVTGGAGFIGANLVRRLKGEGADVVVLDDFSTGFERNLDGIHVRTIRGSVLDPEKLGLAMRGAQSVIHLAAIPSVPRSVTDPLRSHDANATGTARVLEAARDVGAHVTVASSSSVYGANRELPKVETMVARPRSPYAASKLASESYTIAWRATYGLEAIAFRFFNVYGPLQAAGHAYAAVIPSFVKAAIRRTPVTVHGDGHQTRDFTFVDSVTEILATAAIERISCDSPVNLAFGTRRSLIDVLSDIECVVGYPVERRHVEARAGDVRDSQADNSLLRSLFPRACATPFHEGLRRTVSWMAEAP